MERFQTFTPLDFYMVLDLASVLVHILNRAVARYELITVGKPEHMEERLVCINNVSLWKHGCELHGGLVTKHETSLERVCRLGLCVGAGVSTA